MTKRFRYILKDYDDGGRLITYFFTLQEIEAGPIVLNHKRIRIIARDQFTGMQDANGDDIYENDILEFGGKAKNKESIVQWLERKQGWRVQIFGTEDKDAAWNKIQPQHKIVGNVHELKEEKGV